VASKIGLSNGSYVSLWDRLGIADQGRAGGSKRIAIGTRLHDEETASRVGLQVLGMYGHIADEEDGPADRIEREGHQ
jgi:hypothetical protein